MPPLVYQNVRAFVVTGTQTRDPSDAEAAVIRLVLEAKVRLDGHVRDGKQYIAGAGFVHWRQFTAFERRAHQHPWTEGCRYLVVQGAAGTIVEDIIWVAAFYSRDAADRAFGRRVAENERALGFEGAVVVMDRLDGCVLRSSLDEPPHSHRAAAWLRIAEDDLRREVGGSLEG
jgi:hypothetical protein